MKVSRRTFLKTAAATGTGFFVHSNMVALALSNSPEREVYTHCDQCNHVPKCGMKLIVKDDVVYRIEKREGYPNNLVCAKGLSSLQSLYDPHRLLYPLRRTNPKGEKGEWKQITWEEALGEIAAKFNSIKAQYGAEKVLFMTGDPKEPRTILQRLSYLFGSPNMGTESSACYTANELTSKLLFGREWYTASSITSPGIAPTPQTKACFIWGNNPTWAMPFLVDRLRNLKKTVKFVVVDPRVTPTVHAFDALHLQIRPGTDGALALGFAHILIRDNAYDKDMAENWIHGFKEYAEYVKEFTPEKTAEITGIPIDRILAAAELLKEAPVVIRSAPAFGHHTNGVNNYRAMLALVALTGSLDVPGGHIIANEPFPTDLWDATYEFAKSKEYFFPLKPLRVDKEYFPVWAAMDDQGTVQLNKLPEYVKNGDIKGALCLGMNLMMWPQAPEYQEAFKNMDFAVAADYHNNSWTHDYVDMLLPAAMSFERMAPLTIFGRKIFLREPALKPRGEARSDWRICADIGTALGYGEYFYGGGEKAEEECMRDVVRSLYSGITLDDLKKAYPDGIVIPPKNPPVPKKWTKGMCRPDGAAGFTTPSGKIEIYSEVLKEHGFDPLPVYREPVYSPVATPDKAKEFPLLLMTGSREPFYTHSKGRDIPWLRGLMPEPTVRIHPKDAKSRGIREGDYVTLSSPKGAVRLKARISGIVLPGCVDTIHGWAQADVNRLISRDFDPISGFPPYKEGLCEVKKTV